MGFTLCENGRNSGELLQFVRTLSGSLQATLTLLLGTSALHLQYNTAHLKVIMNQLMMDMFTVNQRTWQEDFSLIAQGANDIVHYPKISRGQKQRISEILGDDMARFAQ